MWQGGAVFASSLAEAPDIVNTIMALALEYSAAAAAPKADEIGGMTGIITCRDNWSGYNFLILII